MYCYNATNVDRLGYMPPRDIRSRAETCYGDAFLQLWDGERWNTVSEEWKASFSQLVAEIPYRGEQPVNNGRRV